MESLIQQEQIMNMSGDAGVVSRRALAHGANRAKRDNGEFVAGLRRDSAAALRSLPVRFLLI